MSHIQDLIPYLVGSRTPDSKFDPDQLERGTRVELEHFRDKEDPDAREAARCIAKAHLLELDDYYTRLARLESEARNEAQTKLEG